MEPGWEEIFICWWVELPFTRTTTEVWSERNNEIQQIKIQIPAPGTGILHITVQRVSKVLRSSSAQTDQENLVYSRLNMRQCHDDQQRPGCTSKNMARKCFSPFYLAFAKVLRGFCVLCQLLSSSFRKDINKQKNVWKGHWKRRVSGGTQRGLDLVSLQKRRQKEEFNCFPRGIVGNEIWMLSSGARTRGGKLGKELHMDIGGKDSFHEVWFSTAWCCLRMSWNSLETFSICWEKALSHHTQIWLQSKKEIINMFEIIIKGRWMRSFSLLGPKARMRTASEIKGG